MQSIFRIPWCSEQFGPKASEKVAVDKMRATPVVEIPVLNKLKRKHVAGTEAMSSPQPRPNKQPRPEEQVLPSANTRAPAKSEADQTVISTRETPPVTAAAADSILVDSPLSRGDMATSTVTLDHPNGSQYLVSMASSYDVSMEDAQPATSEDVTSMSKLQQVIENEFNMQILLKHNELRLIEQELAKCQVALEQLRRVELRPFPGNEQPAESISMGTGPSIQPTPGYTHPSHAPPYGVMDGPYSRHYQNWLLPDPQFDSTPLHASFHADSLAHAAGRSTRNSGSVRKSLNKSFTFPSRPTEALHSIPNYPPAAAKDKSSPLILRRSTDKQLVKLMCNNCGRGNFSSIQGFLNHCRIAHKVDYKSHDAAAIDCGRPLDESEAANIPPETHSTPAHRPSLSRVSTAAPTPVRSSNLVHPFNTTGGASAALSSSQRGLAVPRAPVAGLVASGSSAGASLTPSSQLPRLSAHFAKHQLGGDLASAAANATQRIDLGADDELSSPDASGQSSPLEPMSGSRTLSGNGRAGMMAMPGAVPRPSSRKGFRQPTQRPRPSPLAPVPQGMQPESPDIGPSLSPHTADSNPGLVSDHEDDDHGSASEEEAPQAEIRKPFSVGRNCSDHVEIDVTEDEDVHRNAVFIRRNSLFADEERGLHPSPSRKLGLGKRGN